MRARIALGLAIVLSVFVVAPLLAQEKIDLVVAPLLAQEKSDLNPARATELEKRPGVGPKTAAKIIADREANGPFASIQAVVDRIKGIGPKTILKWEGMAVCGAPAAVAPAAAAPEAPAAPAAPDVK
ncbi:MAG: helix-hairpin-helix domain-containing protein [Candidatus Aureabacteria bacterium]|nr:helix-hairpin-helix domain-containing protein [Candidatus Auribacterota bacterium]